MIGSRSDLTRRIAWRMFASGIGCYMLLSPQSLDLMHIHYEAAGGTFLEKMRPGTYCIALAFVLLLAVNGNLLGVAARLLRSQPLLALYTACQFFVLGWSLYRYGISGIAFMIDTILMPVVCVLTLAMIDSRRYYEVLVVVMRFLILNSVIALIEALLQQRLIPMHITGTVDVPDEMFRPSALLGHPLNNSIITVALMPAALFLRISMVWRSLVLLLFWTATLAYGGRTAFVAATAIYGSYFLMQVAFAALRGRFSYLQLTGGLLSIILAAAILTAVVFATGIGDRVFNNLVWDGSAQVRTRIWDILNYLSPQDMLMGNSPDYIIHLSGRLGLGESEGIENFWLFMFLQTGWIGFIPFAIGIASMFLWLLRSTRGVMRLAVLVFFIVASSNNSLTSKTISLSMLAIVAAATRRLPIPGASQHRGAAIAATQVAALDRPRPRTSSPPTAR